MGNLELRVPFGKPRKWPAKTRSADLDWITCTAKRDGSAGQLWDVGARILSDNEAVGYVPTRWQAHGYRGWSSEGVRLGGRTDGSLLSLSSLKCRENWYQALTAAEHCSRVDLCVDVHLNFEVPSLTRDCYESLFHVPPGAGRPAKRTLITDSDGGSTLYVGSRTSDRFARLYDKGIEQAAFRAGKWWRFELEVKGNSSQRIADRLLSAANHRVQCLSTVASYFQQRAALVIPHNPVPVICNEERAPTTDARRLLWLSRQVRSTVQELQKTVGRARVLEALGLLQSERTDP